MCSSEVLGGRDLDSSSFWLGGRLLHVVPLTDASPELEAAKQRRLRLIGSSKRIVMNGNVRLDSAGV